MPHMDDGRPEGTDGSAASRESDRVFVVHGRNERLRDAMFAFLRSIGLRPIEWDQAVALTRKGSPYVGEVLDAAFKAGQAVVVLMSPDDIAYLRGEYASGPDDPDGQPKGQARPNVLFEAGMALGRDEDHTILVEVGDLRPFSDVGGRHTVRMDDTAARRKALAQRLITAGCPVDLSGADWLSAGEFVAPAPGNGLPLGRRVPTEPRRGPSVDARWYRVGGNKPDKLTITNGAVELRDVVIEVPPDLEGVQLWQEQPVKRLPPYKSFSVLGHTGRGIGSVGPQQFELVVAAKLEDGSDFQETVWVDATG